MVTWAVSFSISLISM